MFQHLCSLPQFAHIPSKAEQKETHTHTHTHKKFKQLESIALNQALVASMLYAQHAQHANYSAHQIWQPSQWPYVAKYDAVICPLVSFFGGTRLM